MLSLPCTSYDRILLCLFLVFLTLFWAFLSFQIHPNASYTIGWINHALGTQYTPGKRANIWACIEHDILKKERYDLRRSDLTDLIPYSWRQAAGGTDLADLLYILEGTKDLTEENVENGTYPYDVLECRRALESYFH